MAELAITETFIQAAATPNIKTFDDQVNVTITVFLLLNLISPIRRREHCYLARKLQRRIQRKVICTCRRFKWSLRYLSFVINGPNLMNSKR